MDIPWPGREGVHSETSVSSGFGVEKEKKSTVYFPAPASVNSEDTLTSTGNCNEIHRPCTAEITVGTNPATCTHGEGLAMGECKRFTVLLTDTDFRTSAPRTTTTSQTLRRVPGMQTTQGKTGT